MSAEAQLRSFQLLMDEVSGALAELIELTKQRADSSEEVSSTLSDMVEAMRSGSDASQISEAIKSLRSDAPQVTVQNEINVSPTPIENHITVQPAEVHQSAPIIHILDRPEPRSFQIKSIEYDNRGRMTGAVFQPLSK